MNPRRISIGIVSLILVAGAGAWAFAQPVPSSKPAAQPQPKTEEKEGDEEEVITFEKAPQAVRAAALKLAGDAKNITKVVKEEDDDDMMQYEVEYNDGAVKCSALFSTAGDVMETERSTTEATLPPAALAALKKEYPKATFSGHSLVTRTFYEVDVVIDGKTHEVKVQASGAIKDKSKGGGEKSDKHDGEKD
jgi:hypothetical protein